MPEGGRLAASASIRSAARARYRACRRVLPSAPAVLRRAARSAHRAPHLRQQRVFLRRIETRGKRLRSRIETARAFAVAVLNRFKPSTANSASRSSAPVSDTGMPNPANQAIASAATAVPNPAAPATAMPRADVCVFAEAVDLLPSSSAAPPLTSSAVPSSVRGSLRGFSLCRRASVSGFRYSGSGPLPVSLSFESDMNSHFGRSVSLWRHYRD